jgi:DNA repair protein RadC
MQTLALPPAQCPLERLLAGGTTSLSDAELLAMLLRNRAPSKAAIARAAALLARFGTLAALFAAPRTLLLETPGIGRNGWCSLQAALETSRRSLAEVGVRSSRGGMSLLGKMTAHGWQQMILIITDLWELNGSPFR